MTPLIKELLETIEKSIVRPNRQAPPEWCKENVYLPSPPFNPGGKLNLHLSPYLKKPSEDFWNPKVRETIVVGPPRSGKTLLSQAATLYTIKENPADILLAQHKKDSIKTFYDVRIMPLLKANKVKFADE